MKKETLRQDTIVCPYCGNRISEFKLHEYSSLEGIEECEVCTREFRWEQIMDNGITLWNAYKIGSR